MGRACVHKHLWIYITLTVVLAISALAIKGYLLIFGKVVQTESTTYIYITPENTLQDICEKLQNEALCKQVTGFEWLAEYYHYHENIKTGRFAILSTDRTIDIFRRLHGGMQTPINLVVPSVRTLEQMSARLAGQLMVDSLQIITLLRDSAVCSSKGFTPQTIGCIFVPNTYQVYWNSSPETLLLRMEREFHGFWNEQRTQAAQNMGLSICEVVTLASIVEEESACDAEKPTIAGLYLNRLRKGMLLQADPTVKFAVGDFSIRRILGEHLHHESPYNTYLYKGLPPGPIRIPSIKGIDSVLHYEQHNYLYMCAKADFSGTHQFAESYAAHKANAARYRQALNKLKIYQ